MSASDFRPVFLTVENHGAAILARFTRPQLSEEDNIEQMARELTTLIDHFQCQQLAISLALVEYMTSAALGKLIMIHRKLHRREGKLVVCDITAGVAEILKTSRLDQYFTIAPDANGALGLLASS